MEFAYTRQCTMVSFTKSIDIYKVFKLLTEKGLARICPRIEGLRGGDLHLPYARGRFGVFAEAMDFLGRDGTAAQVRDERTLFDRAAELKEG